MSHPGAESSDRPQHARQPQPAEDPPRTPVRPTRGPNEIPLGAVLLAVLIGLALVGQDHWRRGLLLAGIGLLAAAVLRLVLPARLAGLLVVRGQGVRRRGARRARPGGARAHLQRPAPARLRLTCS